MNQDLLKAKWKQIRGESKIWWAKLTDNDLDRIGGRFDILVGILQEKYGYTRQQAAIEIDRRLENFEASLKKTHPGSKPQ